MFTNTLQQRDIEKIEEGKEIGKEIGKKEGILKTAFLLLDYMDEKTIAEKTGLTLEEVQNLKNNNT